MGRQLGWAGESVSFGVAEGERSPEVVRYLYRFRVGGGTVCLPGRAGRGGANGVVVGRCALGMARGRGKLGLAEVRGAVGRADGCERRGCVKSTHFGRGSVLTDRRTLASVHRLMYG